MYIENLKPLGGIFKPGITKAGRLSLLGNLKDGTKVKVYNSFNLNQIHIRKMLGDIFIDDDVLFPDLIAYDDNFIIEKWIEGKPLDKINSFQLDKSSEYLINFLDKLHNDPIFCKIAKENLNSFCYLKDYLILRLNPWKQWIPVEKLLNAWFEADYQTENIIESKISHPDLSLTNLILSPEKKIYIIDNELLGVGKGWLLDINNSFFRRKVSEPILKPLLNNFYNLSWKLRLVGSALDSGDFDRAKRMAYVE
tara:strand:+ start:245 stop:1000 length:756 start_codon:yes stop_codon:yes gene_type:complete